MNWAQRRKLTYMAIVILVLASIGFAVFRNATKVVATCYDSKQNQGEAGIDCGGPCTFYCPNELADPKVRWVRTFQIAPGVVHAVAYIEHSYPTAAARTMRYSFKLYDDKNTLITERTGTTFLGPMGRTAIAETLIQTGNLIPTTVRFSILPPLPWEKVPVDFSQVVIKTDKTSLETFSTGTLPTQAGTRLTATLDNQSRYQFKALDVVAILYDKDDNVITASKGVLPALGAQGSATMYFTWPFKLPSSAARIEVVPRFNPFTSIQI